MESMTALLANWESAIWVALGILTAFTVMSLAMMVWFHRWMQDDDAAWGSPAASAPAAPPVRERQLAA